MTRLRTGVQRCVPPPPRLLPCRSLVAGAYDPHYPATYSLREQLRDAWIHARARARESDVGPDLMSPAQIAQGALGHLAPRMGPTELSDRLCSAAPGATRGSG